MDAVLCHQVPKLIYMSSLSVIHIAAAGSGSKITENWPLEPHPEKRGLYSQTKLEAERIVTDAVRDRKLRAIILRPGEVIGPDRPFLSGAAAIDAGKRLVVLGNGRSTLPVIWVEDLVDAIMAAADSDRFDGAVVNLVDPEPLTQDDVAKYYLAATGKRQIDRPFSAFATLFRGIRGGYFVPFARPQRTDHALPPAIGDRPPGIRLHCRRRDAGLAAAHRRAARTPINGWRPA